MTNAVNDNGTRPEKEERLEQSPDRLDNSSRLDNQPYPLYTITWTDIPS
jgi:hypothetical protein